MEDGLSGFLVGAFLMFLISGSLAVVASDPVNWKARYQDAVCQSKGLELSTLEGIRVCLDPNSKAVYKIEMSPRQNNTSIKIK